MARMRAFVVVAMGLCLLLLGWFVWHALGLLPGAGAAPDRTLVDAGEPAVDVAAPSPSLVVLRGTVIHP